MRRARVELRIVRRVLSDLRRTGYELDIDDGDEQTPVTDEGEALKLLFNLDEARIYTMREGKTSFVYFVFGNDGYDVISDYGTSLDHVMEPISAWISQQQDAGL